MTTKTKQKRTPDFPLYYQRCLEDTLRAIQSELADFDWHYDILAKHARLSPQTVYRFANRQTKYPRYMTIVKMANALGIKISFSSKKKP